MKRKPILFLTQSAMVAALYVLLSLLSNLFGLANGVVQVRLSEALTILPLFGFSPVPGLFAGCLLANLLTGATPIDVIIGSFATLLGALGTFAIGKKIKEPAGKWLAPFSPILFNCLLIPPVLKYAYGFTVPYPVLVAFVALGEVISCGILGLLLYRSLKPYGNLLFH